MIQGYRLRQIREQRALSQGTLGKLVGQDAQYISKLERGVRLSVHTTTLGRLVSALQVSADYLLGFSDCETLPRRRGTNTPAGRQRQTTARHRNGSASNRVTRPTPPAPPDQRTHAVNTDSAVAVASRDQPAAHVRPLMCPHCYAPMQHLVDGPRVACPACRYTFEQNQ